MKQKTLDRLHDLINIIKDTSEYEILNSLDEYSIREYAEDKLGMVKESDISLRDFLGNFCSDYVLDHIPQKDVLDYVQGLDDQSFIVDYLSSDMGYPSFSKKINELIYQLETDVCQKLVDEIKKYQGDRIQW